MRKVNPIEVLKKSAIELETMAKGIIPHSIEDERFLEAVRKESRRIARETRKLEEQRGKPDTNTRKLVLSGLILAVRELLGWWSRHRHGPQ